jgi:Kdo2-lipid IVA lauroyltransferase/acyltransferase
MEARSETGLGSGAAAFRRFLRFWLLRIILLPLVVLPPRAARGVGMACGTVAWHLLPRLRRRTLRHLRVAYPAATNIWIRRTAHGVFRWVGRAGADFLHVGRINDATLATIEIEGMAHWDAALRRGKGVILVTGHFGNWEVLGAWLAALGLPIWVIYHPFREERLDRFVRGRRERAGVRGIPAGGPSLRALRALRRGEILGILIDRVPRGDSVACMFFGRECRAAPGPARLALAAGAPLVPACLTYRRGGMRVRFETPIDPAEFSTGADPAAAVREITQRLARVLEDWIRESPEQWPWFHDRWKVRGSIPTGALAALGGASGSGGGVRKENGALGRSGPGDGEGAAPGRRQVLPPRHQHEGASLGP